MKWFADLFGRHDDDMVLGGNDVGGLRWFMGGLFLSRSQAVTVPLAFRGRSVAPVTYTLRLNV